jgi:transcriptional regulator
MEVKEGDTLTQKQIVGAFLESQGFEQSEIQETLEDYEDAGILERHAKKALTRMQAKQAQEKKTLIERQQQQAQQAAQENERMWTEINSIVNSGELRGLTVPERDKKRFFDWMATPIDAQGNSQRAVDRAKLDQETLLALEYIVYKGFDLSKLIANNTKTEKARSLRSKLSKSTSSNTRMKNSKPGYTKAQKLPDLKDLL